jgi:hypothetical protein
MPNDLAPNNYQPPKTTIEVMANIELEEPLQPGDPRFVDTNDARGANNVFAKLMRAFNFSPAENRFVGGKSKHVLFYGHVGSGKSTELRRLESRLRESHAPFLLIYLDVAKELDRNNLNYADVLMALAKHLFDKAGTLPGIDLSKGALQPLERWFREEVLTEEKSKDYEAKLVTEVKGETGIPFVAKFLAGIASTFRTNSSYKQAYRQTITREFTYFALAFNQFLKAVEAQLRDNSLAQRVLFVVDGTDKLSQADTEALFVHNVTQLTDIEGYVLYTAPLHMRYRGAVSHLAHVMWPMVKLQDPSGKDIDAGHSTMMSMLYARADRSLFHGKAADTLVKHSGGHPRELLYLLRECAAMDEDNRIDDAIVARAVKQRAWEFGRWLTAEDYDLLVKEDQSGEGLAYATGMDRLIVLIALLEYNDGSWRRSHPVIRTLQNYTAAQARLAQAETAAKP